MAASIITDKLTKIYPGTTVAALDNLSIDIKAGEIYGYLGANGAGKTTTIRLLMNFLRPSGGHAHINGLDIVKDSVQIKRRVGYLAGDVTLYQKATGRELLDYLADLHGGVDHKYRHQLEKRFEAEVDKPISALSKGNRQKIGILQALMHQPEVLILDEPTSGLDPLMQEAFYATLREARGRGAAVLMSSHNLAEAQSLCDRIGIIKHGKLIRELTIDKDTELGKPVFRVSLVQAADMAKLKKAEGLKWLSQVSDNTAIVQSRGSLSAALSALAGFEISNFSTEQLSLEDEFIEFYGDKQ